MNYLTYIKRINKNITKYTQYNIPGNKEKGLSENRGRTLKHWCMGLDLCKYELTISILLEISTYKIKYKKTMEFISHNQLTGIIMIVKVFTLSKSINKFELKERKKEKNVILG